MTIDQQASRLWAGISPQKRAAFFSCLVTGFLVHLFAFTNIIPNSDGLSRVFDTQQMTISGRWFLHYASALNGFTQMPMVIALLSLVFLGLAAALTADILRLESKALSALAGAVMAAFPCLGYTFLYLFTASAYCLSILLAVLSVWLARRKKPVWLLGIVCLALSMGIYQAYVTVALSLALLAVIREILDPSATFSGTFRLGLRLLGCLAAGAVAYYITLLIFLKVKNLELLSYLGMDAASSGYPLSQLPRLLLAAYKQVVSFFFLPGGADGFANGWMVLLDVLAGILGLCCVVRLWKALSHEPWRLWGGLAMLALLPLGMEFSQLLSPYSTPTPMMKYALVAVYLLLLLLCDRVDVLPKPKRSLVTPAVALWTAAVLLFCLNTNNLLYTASYQAHRATESYMTRLLTRIESCSGYEEGMEVVIIGAVPTDQIYAQIESYAQVSHYSLPTGTLLTLNKHIYYYLNDWLNVPIAEPDEATMVAVSDSPEFQAMPLYPAEGSVQVLDGRVVVRLQEQYTPKASYELAYENRR